MCATNHVRQVYGKRLISERLEDTINRQPPITNQHQPTPTNHVRQVYGKRLISERPEDTTRLLMELCLPPMSALPSGMRLHM